MEEYQVTLASVISELKLEVCYLPTPAENILITNNHVNRPGLPLTGFFEHFEHTRLQLIGKTEYLYLEQLTEEERMRSLEGFFSRRPAGVVITTSLAVHKELLDMAEKYEIPILRTQESTSEFMAAIIAYLNIQLAPRLTRHGVLVEVYGEGILLLGDSGVGKSETAIELVKRGHRLIADDAVEIKRVSSKTLVGQAPEIIRHYVELRGIGIVNVQRLFGMGAVNSTEKIDLVIRMEQWVKGKMYDRLGLDNDTEEILGLKIPSLTIPVSPGRNLAIIIEIAAMNNRQKKMGYNTAEEFNKRLMESMSGTME